MALVNKATGNFHSIETEKRVERVSKREIDNQRKRARTLAKQQQVAERIAAAVNQLASGLSESASAAEEMRRAGDQNAAGAEQSSGASQESLTAFKQVSVSIDLQMERSENARNASEETKEKVIETGEGISRLIANVNLVAARQKAVVKVVEQLENKATDIGDIVKVVSKIADQTNLLALNAAIEAARAGEHGAGFAVVADEVRGLAENSEKNAQNIQELVLQFLQEVKVIAAGIQKSAKTAEGESEKGKIITEQLAGLRDLIQIIVQGVQEIASQAEQSKVATGQALKGAEEIAAAAEEQSAAAEEVARTVAEQVSALEGGDQAAQNLAELAEDLKNSTDISKSSEEVASSAEELAAMVQEINKSGNQISTAFEQITKGAQASAAATGEFVAAVTQIEKGLQITEEKANVSDTKIMEIKENLAVNKKAVDEIIRGISQSAEATTESIDQVTAVEQVSRLIDKAIQSISTIAIQTNMLAVSGSIEAARAGDFGKGFAVVASDIRNLAQDSSENADRINDLVKAVQDQIRQVARDLTEISQAVAIEIEAAKTTTQNLIEIKTAADTVEQNGQEIKDSVLEISTAIAQVKKGAEQISATAKEAEQAAGEANRAAEEQAKGTEELAAAIEEIASMADELQSL